MGQLSLDLDPATETMRRAYGRCRPLCRRHTFEEVNADPLLGRCLRMMAQAMEQKQDGRIKNV